MNNAGAQYAALVLLWMYPVLSKCVSLTKRAGCIAVCISLAAAALYLTNKGQAVSHIFALLILSNLDEFAEGTTYCSILLKNILSGILGKSYSKTIII